MSPNLSVSFWARMGLHEADRDVCIRAVQAVYPEHNVDELSDQAASYIVQIRPKQHALNISIADAARKIYGSLAPRTRELKDVILPGDLVAVEMEKLEGVPLSKLNLRVGPWEKKVVLVESFARTIAAGWSDCSTENEADLRHARADTPIEAPWLEQHCAGKVGREIISKMRKAAEILPDDTLRSKANESLEGLLAIRDFPVTLNHGDLIPSNILIDPESWEVVGLVDWAEAEWLPFGTCLYGLEHFLGSVETGGGVVAVWNYDSGSAALRQVFWDALEREKPEIGTHLEKVQTMQDVGVFLWYGYAWDEGKIDRVVNERDDANEVACLRAFLE